MVQRINTEIVIQSMRKRRWNKTFLHCNLNMNCQGKVNKMKKDMGKDLNNKMFAFSASRQQAVQDVWEQQVFVERQLIHQDCRMN